MAGSEGWADPTDFPAVVRDLVKRVNRIERGSMNPYQDEVVSADSVMLDDGTALPQSLQDIYDASDIVAQQAADAAFQADASFDAATAASAAAANKSKVIYSNNAPGSTANTAGDIWFQRDGTPSGSIIAQYEGLGGTSWTARQLRNEVIANLDAGKITAGTAFINSLIVKTNFTLGDASTDGVIQSYNYNGSSVGVIISKNGIVAKGGSLTGSTITGADVIGGTITGGTTITGPVIRTAASGQRMEFSQDLNAGVMRFYTGDPSETSPGYLNPYLLGTGTAAQGGIEIRTSVFNSSAVGAPRIQMSSASASGTPSSILLDTQSGGSVTLKGKNVIVDGRTTGGLAVLTGATAQVRSVTGTLLLAGDGTGGVAITGITTVNAELHSTVGIWSDNLNGGGTTGASLGNEGRLVRTGVSSRRYKDDITPLSLEEARKVLDIEAVTYRYKHESDIDVVYPGVIAEQAEEVGANLWVYYNQDGAPEGFRYAEMVVAHNMIMAAQEERIAQLEALVAQMG